MKVLAETYSKFHGRQIDMNEEILCTVGAYGSLFCAIQGLINPGDEVRRLPMQKDWYLGRSLTLRVHYKTFVFIAADVGYRHY